MALQGALLTLMGLVAMATITLAIGARREVARGPGDLLSH